MKYYRNTSRNENGFQTLQIRRFYFLSVYGKHTAIIIFVLINIYGCSSAKKPNGRVSVEHYNTVLFAEVYSVKMNFSHTILTEIRCQLFLMPGPAELTIYDDANPHENGIWKVGKSMSVIINTKDIRMKDSGMPVKIEIWAKDIIEIKEIKSVPPKEIEKIFNGKLQGSRMKFLNINIVGIGRNWGWSTSSASIILRPPACAPCCYALPIYFHALREWGISSFIIKIDKNEDVTLS